jgi:transposase
VAYPWIDRGGLEAQAILWILRALICRIEQRGNAAVIPSRSNRKVFRVIDPILYRRRNVIERWFGRLKGFRRVATRYEKTLASYVGVVATAAFVVALSG